MSNIQLFNYDEHAVRVVERNGIHYWVAKDVCNILGYVNSSDAIAKHLDDDERDIQLMDTTNGQHNMTIITESGLYSLIFRSVKPEAKNFARWVRKVALPQINKSDAYKPQPARLTKSIMYSAKMIFEAAGIKDNQLAIALDKVVDFFTGQSILAVSGVVLEAPTKNQLLTPALIGQHFGVPARKVNEILTAEGYQHKVGGEFEPLELGLPFAVMVDTTKRNYDGSPVRLLKWDSSILDEIESLFNN